MTLIRRLHPNDAKKIEEIEARFMNLRSIDDPFATLVAVSSDQPPPILTNSAFDDDNNWKRHAAIVLANLNSQTAMQTVRQEKSKTKTVKFFSDLSSRLAPSKKRTKLCC